MVFCKTSTSPPPKLRYPEQKCGTIARHSACGEHGTIGMLREIKKTALAALIVILSACQSQPITYYTPPAEVLQESLPTLVGSKVRVPNIFFGDEITYVRAIDKLPVAKGSKNYDIPIQVSLGKHVIRIGFSQGSGCAEAIFELNMQSGISYIARGKKLGRESIFRQENLRLWIEDRSGTPVTNDVIVPFGFCGGGFGLIIV